jgi:hypothetical protein
MNQRGLRSNAGLVFLVIVALIYGVYESAVIDLTQWDGALGVVLGLFICAQPAANLLDSLYRSSRDRSREPRWLESVLNALAMLAGITIIIIGTTQLSRASAAR